MDKRYLFSSSEKGKKQKSGFVKIAVGDKVVGIVAGKTFIKNLHSTRHFLRKPPAIGFDEACIEKVVNLGATTIKIIDLDTAKTYEATIALVREKGIHIDRGYGPQLALPLQYWKCEQRSNGGNHDQG